MLEIYAKEFVAIGMHLLGKGKRKGDYITIAKTELEELLNKNQYDTAKNKLKIWKALHWIDTDKDRRYTKRVYDSSLKRYVPSVKMSIDILELLNELCQTAKRPC